MHALLEKIEAYDTITIFRHVGADSDALGSQFGLKQFIEDHYPKKKVYALGDDLGPAKHMFPPVDHIDDDTVQNSLAIILDTANHERVDDIRYQTARYRIRVDHHIRVDDFCEEEFIDEKAGATCQILGFIFKENACVLSKKAATFLYMGLLSDTVRFSIEMVSKQTFLVAQYLIEQGVDIAPTNALVYNIPKHIYDVETMLRNELKVYKDHIAYASISKAQYEALFVSYEEVKARVYVFANIQEYSIWCLFVEDPKTGLYNASIRSREFTIQTVAKAYGGGGHRLAAGIKGLSELQVTSLLEDLSKQCE